MGHTKALGEHREILRRGLVQLGSYFREKTSQWSALPSRGITLQGSR